MLRYLGDIDMNTKLTPEDKARMEETVEHVLNAGNGEVLIKIADRVILSVEAGTRWQRRSKKVKEESQFELSKQGGKR